MLSHFGEDCILESPMAATGSGRPVVEGKQALRKYWQAAVGRIKSLKFELENAVWDPHQHTLVVFYVAAAENRRTTFSRTRDTALS